MPKTPAQKIRATTPSSTTRPPEPLCSSRSRASALRHLGVSTVQKLGRMAFVSFTGLDVENGVELMIPQAAGELQEEIFQSHVLGRGLLLNLCHGSVCH